MRDEIVKALKETAAVHEALAGQQAEAIERLAQVIADALAAGGALYVMGNGGSAADAQHMAGELVGRFEVDRRPLRCAAFTTDTSVLTAVANDYGVEKVFVRQVQAFVESGDVVMGISTSGESANVNRALEDARRLGAATVGLTGRSGGRMRALCDAIVCVPSDSTPRVQEAHQTIIHIICRFLERRLCGA